jgi:3-hydroxyisobutyrate dehydrogenase-like beta-hydroxyacid dehydrogenase
MRIGFVGLGKMGSGIARNLIAAGHRLAVYNRSRGSVEELVALGAEGCDSPARAADGAEVLFSMLSDDAVTEALILGAGKETGAIGALPKGALHIATSTLSPAFADRLTQAHAEHGQGYLSAPVFGRPTAAAEKKLYVVVAGRTELVAKARGLLDAISQGVFVAGGRPSTANTIKIAGNFLIAAMLESLGEALALVRKSGVEGGQFLEIANTALFKSPLYANYGRAIVEEKFEPAGFALQLGLKDVRLAAQAADRAEVPMPFASVLHDQFLTALAQGWGERDWAAIAQLCARNAGLDHRK